eukprot:7016340-Prorocentrum_lima.AAC.1
MHCSGSKPQLREPSPQLVWGDVELPVWVVLPWYEVRWGLWESSGVTVVVWCSLLSGSDPSLAESSMQT